MSEPDEVFDLNAQTPFTGVSLVDLEMEPIRFARTYPIWKVLPNIPLEWTKDDIFWYLLTRINVLKSVLPDISPDYQKKVLEELEHFRIFLEEMSKYHVVPNLRPS